MFAFVAEDLHQQVRRPVCNSRLSLAIQRAVDHAEELHNPVHPVQIANLRLQRAQQTQRCQPSGPVPSSMLRSAPSFPETRLPSGRRATWPAV